MATGTRRRSARCRSSTATPETKFDVKLASLDALDAIKQKPSRVCPLVCEHGFKADGDRCSRIVCADGSFLNDDNECEKRRGKTPIGKARSPTAAERVVPGTTEAGGRPGQAAGIGLGPDRLRYGRLPPGAARLSPRIPNLRPGRPLGRWRRQRSDLQMMRARYL